MTRPRASAHRSAAPARWVLSAVRSAPSPRYASRGTRRLLLACCALLVVGCGAPAPMPSSNDPGWTPPPDWTTVSDGRIQLTLPPWLETFDASVGIFANERPHQPGADIPMQLLALGPDRDALEPGMTLESWVDRRLANPAEGIPTVTPVRLPPGAGIRYERTDRDATGWAWRFLVFALETPAGVLYLQLDGPPESWASRAADLERVAMLMRVRR